MSPARSAATRQLEGERFIECDYWSGQMMQEFYNELQSGNGPVFLKLDHWPKKRSRRSRPSCTATNARAAALSRQARQRLPQADGRDAHLGDRLLQRHSASGIHINARGETSVKGLYAAAIAQRAAQLHARAFVYGKLCGENAASYCAEVGHATPDAEAQAAESARIRAPLELSGGLTPYQIEYKTRRLVNDYLQPPKVTSKYQIGLRRFAEIREDMQSMSAGNPHELMRAMEAHSILDCAEMAAHASMFRTESRWGLYHHYVDHPNAMTRTGSAIRC